ncbi:hypothetical protein JYT59_00385 [Sphingobacteriaceae bacterium AH-315-L07]|nr:hypothetical protein [Sphingobacteriaceae bacterium AH-315-L07]
MKNAIKKLLVLSLSIVLIISISNTNANASWCFGLAVFNDIDVTFADGTTGTISVFVNCYGIMYAQADGGSNGNGTPVNGVSNAYDNGGNVSRFIIEADTPKEINRINADIVIPANHPDNQTEKDIIIPAQKVKLNKGLNSYQVEGNILR